MPRPLYKIDGQFPVRRASAGHAGLWFDKFCDRWRVDEGSWTLGSAGDEGNPKLDWIPRRPGTPRGSRGGPWEPPTSSASALCG